MFTLPLMLLHSLLVNELNKDFSFFLVIVNVSYLKGNPKNSNHFSEYDLYSTPCTGFTEDCGVPCAVWTCQDGTHTSTSLYTEPCNMILSETMLIITTKIHTYFYTDILISNLLSLDS